MKQTVRASFILLLLAILGGCGGGASMESLGSNNDKPQPVSTKAIKITVIDGYIEGATVCVDKNNNGSCEAEEPQGTTGADGQASLNVPIDDVGKFPVVAYVPPNAIDKDDGKPVGTAYTMKAPAEQSQLVTPFTTMVQHLVDTKGMVTAQAITEVKNKTGVDPATNYLQSGGNAQAQVMAKTVVKLMQDKSAEIKSADTEDKYSSAERNNAVLNSVMSVIPTIKENVGALTKDGATCQKNPNSDTCQQAVLGEIEDIKQLAQRSVSFSPANPKLNEPVTFTANNIGSNIWWVVWNYGDGTRLDSTSQYSGKFLYGGKFEGTPPPANSTSQVTHTFTSAKGAGEKKVTVYFENTYGNLEYAETVIVPVADNQSETISQTATITSVKEGAVIIPNGGRARGKALTLQGSYQGGLTNADQVVVYVNGVEWDTATVNQAEQTWAASKPMPQFGKTAIKVAIARNSQNGLHGVFSAEFIVDIGNTSTPSSLLVNAWDDWVVTITNVWSNIKSVVITLANNAADISDGVTAKTIENVNALSQYVSSWTVVSGFTTEGDKTIRIEYKDGEGKTVNEDTLSLKVARATSSIEQTATIEGANDHRQFDIPDGGSTSETPYFKGSISAPIGKFYDVRLYDNDSSVALTGLVNYNADRTRWTFVPDTAMAPGAHAFKAAVVRADGVFGVRSSTPYLLTVTASEITKIGSNGLPLPIQSAKWSDTGNEAQGTQWDCILDEVTGQMWEVKRKDPRHLRDVNATYTYYDSGAPANGRLSDSQSGGQCTGLADNSQCNTEAYVRAVNAVGLCGKKDWRLPDTNEYFKKVKGFPSIYFPYVNAFWLESSSNAFNLIENRYGFNDVFEYPQGSVGAESVLLVRNERPQAKINAVSANNVLIKNSATSSYKNLLLQGRYDQALGNNYEVRIFDNEVDIGSAVLNEDTRTWSFASPELDLGQHYLTASVVRKSDKLRGIQSAAYAVYIGSKIVSETSSPNILDRILLNVANGFSTARSVIWKFISDADNALTELADGIATKTVSVAASLWDPIEVYFLTSGTKTITAEFKEQADGGGDTISKEVIQISVGVGAVTTIADVKEIIDDRTEPNKSIGDDQPTTNQQPLIKVRTSTPLSKYYNVQLYKVDERDRITLIPIETTASSVDMQFWDLRPKELLAYGDPKAFYYFVAKVKRFDGVTGEYGTLRRVIVTAP